MNLRDKGGVTWMHYENQSSLAASGFEFGRGLSYSTFEFTTDKPKLVANTAELKRYHPQYYADRSSRNCPVQVFIKVKNTGPVASAVVVLGFVRSNHTDAPRNGELAGFARVHHLAPGDSTTVPIGIPPQVLSLVDEHGVESLRPGAYTLQFGVEGGSEGIPVTVQLQLEGEQQVIFDMPAARSRDAARL